MEGYKFAIVCLVHINANYMFVFPVRLTLLLFTTRYPFNEGNIILPCETCFEIGLLVFLLVKFQGFIEQLEKISYDNMCTTHLVCYRLSHDNFVTMLVLMRLMC